MAHPCKQLVFICHSSVDKVFVRKLAAELQEHGIGSWVDEAELHFGDSLITKLSDAIEQIALVLAVISESSVDSAWVRQELEWAMTKEIRDRRITVIPILIQQCDIPFFLLNKLYADFTESASFAAMVGRLAASIRHHLDANSTSEATEASFGQSITHKATPFYLAYLLELCFALIGTAFLVFPNVADIPIVSPGKMAPIAFFVSMIGALLLGDAVIGIAALVMLSHMSKHDPNFARDLNEIRIAGLLNSRYRALLRRYWHYRLVKVIVFAHVASDLIKLALILFTFLLGRDVLRGDFT